MIITDVYSNTFSGNGRRCRIPLFADRQEGVPALVSSGGICGVSSRLAYHSPTGDIEVMSRSIATKENTSSATAVILFAVALSLAIRHSCLATHHSCLATDADALATRHSCLATDADALATRYSCLATDADALATHHSCLATRANALATHHSCLATRANMLATRANSLATRANSLATRADTLATRADTLATYANALATHHSCLATRANTLATRYFYSAVDKNDSFIHHFHYTDNKTIAQKGAKQLKGNYSEYFTTYFYN